MRMLENWSTKKIQIASPEKKNLTVQLTGFLMSVGEFSFSFKVLPGRSGHHLSTYDEANVKNIGNEWYIIMALKGLNSGAKFTVLKKRKSKCCFCNYKLFSFVRTAFFSSFSLHTIAKIASITVRIIALLDFISTFHIKKISDNITNFSSLLHSSQEHLNPQMTSSHHLWLHSSVV